MLVPSIRIKNLSRYPLQIAVAVAALLFPFVFKSPFVQRMAIIIYLYAALAGAWNILGGYAGQASLGHAAYFGLGAYASSLMVINGHWNPWIALIAGGLLVAGIALVLGLLMFRIAPWYFTITTIALAEVVYAIALNSDYMGGARGLFLPLLDESWKNLTFSSKIPFYFVTLVLLCLVTLATHLLARSRAGYYFRAIRDDAVAANSLGVEIFGYKLLALVISAFFSSLAGSIYAQYVMYIDPESMLIMAVSIQIVLVCALGGIGTVWGPIIGSIVLMPLTEFTRIYMGGGGRAVDLIMYSVLLLGIAVWQPSGILGWLEGLRKK